MKISEIEQKVLQSKIPIDFIATCITPWHLTGIFAFLAKIHEEENRTLRGVVAVRRLFNSDYLIDVANIEVPHYINVEFCMLDENKTGIDIRKLFRRYKHKTVSHNLYIISVISPWLRMAYQCIDHKGVRIKLVVVDEGLSYYFGRWHWIRQRLFIEKDLKQTVRVAVKYVIMDMLKIIFGCAEEKFTLLCGKGKSYYPNYAVVKYYKTVIHDKKQELSSCIRPPYAIFFTQPLVEDGLMHSRQLFEFYRKINSIFKTSGISLYFKVHPREKNLNEYQRNSLCLIDEKMSAEEFVSSSVIKPTLILGFFTTSLVSVKLFYDIETISLNRLIAGDTLSKELRRVLNDFDTRFSAIVKTPDYGELKEILSER